MKRVKLFIPLIVFAVLVGFFWRGLSLDPNAMPSALIDKAFPVFSLSRLQDDTPVYRDSLLGDVHLVNVWATWCRECWREHEYLLALAEQRNINIIGLNWRDERADAKSMISILLKYIA